MFHLSFAIISLVVCPLLNINSVVCHERSKLKQVFVYTIYLENFVVGTFIINGIQIFEYFLLHLTQQYILLNIHLKHLTLGFKNVNASKKRRWCFYQDVIYQRLCFCIQHHTTLLRYIGKNVQLFVCVVNCFFFFLIILFISISNQLNITSWYLIYFKNNLEQFSPDFLQYN